VPKVKSAIHCTEGMGVIRLLITVESLLTWQKAKFKESWMIVCACLWKVVQDYPNTSLDETDEGASPRKRVARQALERLPGNNPGATQTRMHTIQSRHNGPDQTRVPLSRQHPHVRQ